MPADIQGRWPPVYSAEDLSAVDVAAWLRTTRRALYARVDRGEFRTAVVRVGRRLYFRSDVLLASLSQQGRVP
jgi:hypothetical protein